MNPLFLNTFTGIGLFLIGVRLLTLHMQQVGQQRLRSFLARLGRSGWRLRLVGLVAGAGFQSVNALIQVVVALVHGLEKQTPAEGAGASSTWVVPAEAVWAAAQPEGLGPTVQRVLSRAGSTTGRPRRACVDVCQRRAAAGRWCSSTPGG